MLWYNSPEAVKVMRKTSLGRDDEVTRRSLLRLIDRADKR
jgi:hypothetical protein